MHLRTLGGLVLHGAKTRREKPLLLVAYLALEGSRPRRTLAELFWPDEQLGGGDQATACLRCNRGG
jgi:hypothetical protein